MKSNAFTVFYFSLNLLRASYWLLSQSYSKASAEQKSNIGEEHVWKDTMV